MKLIVTGGAGFIGSNFIFYLREKHPEDELICVDKLTYAGRLETLAPVMGDSGFRFVRLDIADREAIYALFEETKPDAVVNFAAESHVDRSIEQPALFLETNLMGTQVLLDACRLFGVKRFHQVSTDEVYGDLPLGKAELRFHEHSPLRPSSPYAASKAAADLLCLAYHRTYGLPVTISRCSNNYGPRQLPEKLIPRMITLALAGQPLPVYGNGQHVRDWLYVEDHCAAVDLILRQGEEGGIYNVGGHGERPNLDVVRFICASLGKPDSLIRFVQDRPGHDRRYAVDPGLICRELGWKPKTPFDEGLRETIRWYLDNRSWWDPLVVPSKDEG